MSIGTNETRKHRFIRSLSTGENSCVKGEETEYGKVDYQGLNLINQTRNLDTVISHPPSPFKSLKSYSICVRDCVCECIRYTSMCMSWDFVLLPIKTFYWFLTFFLVLFVYCGLPHWIAVSLINSYDVLRFCLSYEYNTWQKYHKILKNPLFISK